MHLHFKKMIGFSLIELVIVIVVLGILAIVAIPQFINLSGDAYQNSVKGIAGALGSASAINYTARKENSANGISILNCTTVASLLTNSTLPTSYVITSLAVTSGTTSVCTLTAPNGSIATFNAMGIN